MATEAAVPSHAACLTVYGEETRQRGKSLNKENQKFVLSLKICVRWIFLPRILEAGIFFKDRRRKNENPRYTAGVVTFTENIWICIETYGKDGYYVDPEDKKNCWICLTGEVFASGYYEAQWKRHGRFKRKPEFREGNQKLFDFLDANYVEKKKRNRLLEELFLRKENRLSWNLKHRKYNCKKWKDRSAQVPRTSLQQRKKVLNIKNKTGATSFTLSSWILS